ncbi:TPA: glucosyltransferase domain-containing protein [Proteus mirabilis]|nr:glucosyltransferase domain-containing protein [Proteus mirabilis]
MKLDNGEKTIFLLTFLFALPIFMSGILYQDDILRSANGEAYWGVLGRPLSDFFVMLIGFGRDFVINTFPLSLVIATVALSSSSIILYRRFSIQKNIFSGLVFSIFSLSPLYLQNLSYQFDSMPMMLGVLFSVLPYSNLINNLSTRYKLLISSILLISSLSLYQATINIFIGLAAFEAIYLILQKKDINEIIKIITIKVTMLFISMFIYMMVIAKIFVSSAVNTSLIFSSANPSGSFFINIDKILRILDGMNNSPFYLAWSIPVIISLFAFLLLISKTLFSNKSKTIKLLELLILIFSVFIILFSIIGPFVFIDKTIIAPRVMMGLPVVFLLITYLCSTYKSNFVMLISCSMPILISLSISSAYGNATKYQRSLEESIFYNISSSIPKGWDNKKIIINGSVSVSAATKMEFNRYPILRWMVIPLNDWSGMVMLKHYNIDATMGRINTKKTDKCIYDNAYFSLCEGEVNIINLK